MLSLGTGDTARLWACAALSLLMGPGIALFYEGASQRSGGVRQRPGLKRDNGLRRTLIVIALALLIVAAQWVVVGYSLVFDPADHSFVGGLGSLLLAGPLFGRQHTPTEAPFVLLQLGSALVGPCVLASALRARLTFRAYAVLLLLWSTLVYDPIAHWVLTGAGWLARLGALDIAGGTVIHLTAGVSALVCAALATAQPPGASKSERGYRQPAARIVVGATLFALGSFGWMVGGALARGDEGVHALTGAALGALGGAFGWLVGETATEPNRSPSPLGIGAGVVVGLVAIAPASGTVSTMSALTIGFIAAAVFCGTAFGLVAGLMAGLLAITAGAGYVSPATALAIAFVAGSVCYGAVLAKNRAGDGRSFDPFGIHAVGGVIGVILAGIFAHGRASGTDIDGALFGNVRQLGFQLLACAATAAYAGVVTFLILKVIWRTSRLPKLENRREGEARMPREPIAHRTPELYPE